MPGYDQGMTDVIYKICDADEWRLAEEAGEFAGAAIDLTDGFIHFSSAAQVAETAAKHFSGRENLVLVTVKTEPLGDALKWEPSRGGDLFPHLYNVLRMEAVSRVEPLDLDSQGHHVFPDLA